MAADSNLRLTVFHPVRMEKETINSINLLISISVTDEVIKMWKAYYNH